MRKKTNNKAMVGELKSLALISAGLVVGSMGGKAIDKALKVDNTFPDSKPRSSLSLLSSWAQV